MYEVTIFPTTLSPWFSQVYLGLYELQKDGLATISVSAKLVHPELMDGTAMQIDVVDTLSGEHRKIIFELTDCAPFSVPDMLDWGDYIVKRSLNWGRIAHLSQEKKAKVIPYGINFNCGGPVVPWLELFLHHQMMRFRLFKTGVLHGKGFRLQHQIRFLMYLFRNGTSLSEEDFEEVPQSKTRYRVFFLTRLWAHATRKGEITDYSRKRIELVKALREEFGEGFYGGIVQSDLSRKNCPEELLFQKVSRREFGRKLKQSDISICTLGVGHSNPWKLGESIAASRCIVSEPLFYELSAPLEEGVHIRTFRENEECISICRELIDKPELLQTMKENIHHYYNENVKSKRLLENVFQKIFEKQT